MQRFWAEYVEKEDLAKTVGKMIDAESVTEPIIIGMLNDEPVFEIQARIWGDIDNLLFSVLVNAYGLVDRRKTDELYQLPYGKDILPLIELFKNSTLGIKINDKTYIESFKEIHIKDREEVYTKKIKALEKQVVELKNKQIRTKSAIEEFLSESDISN